MRVVLDTNILARAASGPPGPAHEVMRRCTLDPHLLCLSPYLLAELSRVLRYPRVRKVHGMSDDEIDVYLHDLQSVSLLVPVPVADVDAVVPSDPDDDPIVATAVLGGAQVLCTRDRHLLRQNVVDYCAARGTEVLTELELLDRLRSAGS